MERKNTRKNPMKFIVIQGLQGVQGVFGILLKILLYFIKRQSSLVSLVTLANKNVVVT